MSDNLRAGGLQAAQQGNRRSRQLRDEYRYNSANLERLRARAARSDRTRAVYSDIAVTSVRANLYMLNQALRWLASCPRNSQEIVGILQKTADFIRKDYTHHVMQVTGSSRLESLTLPTQFLETERAGIELVRRLPPNGPGSFTAQITTRCASQDADCESYRNWLVHTEGMLLGVLGEGSHQSHIKLGLLWAHERICEATKAVNKSCPMFGSLAMRITHKT